MVRVIFCLYLIKPVDDGVVCVVGLYLIKPVDDGVVCEVGLYLIKPADTASLMMVLAALWR